MCQSEVMSSFGIQPAELLETPFIWIYIIVDVMLNLDVSTEVPGSRISQRGAPTPQFEDKTYYLARFFTKNCIK